MIYISTMNKTDTLVKDWNLLGIFESLMRTGNVSKSANELSLSQSAVSHALARLREMFQDPLFTRLPRGISPTPRALELAPRISGVLLSLNELITSADFRPVTAKGKIAIASTEYIELTLLKPFFHKMRSASPDLTFQFRNAQGRLPKIQIERGEFDIAIAGFFGALPDGFYQQKLFENDFVCVARKSHPVLKSKFTLDIYTQVKHLLLSPQGDLWGLIDEKLLHMQRSRRVVAGFENYLTAGWYTAESDVVVTVPRSLGEFYAKTLDLKLFELPFESPKITIVQAWHERTHSSPLHRYVRDLIFQSAKKR